MSSITRITTPATEKGTAVFTVAFTDQASAAVVPNSGLTWTLSDTLGAVVNSRSAVSLTAAATVYIVLSGSDLALSSSYAGSERVLTVEGTYNTTVGGVAQTNLPLKLECHFVIQDLVKVS